MILNDKYVIFLHKRYLKNKKLVKSIENKGVIIIEFNKYIENIKKKVLRNQPTLLFDNNIYPSANLLYIHLVNDNYYNYINFNQKYIDFYQDILFITSVKLGAKKIHYVCEHINTTITKQYNITEVNIKDYFKGTHTFEINKLSLLKYTEGDLNLKNFIYKRQSLKMLKLEYNIQNENINELIFSILLILLDFNIINNFEKYSNTILKYNYNIEFYTDVELNESTELTDIDNYIIEKNKYIKEIKEINKYLDKEETDMMLEISNIADTNDVIKLDNEIIKNQMSDIYSEIEYNNNNINKLKDDLSEEKITMINYDIQVNHILLIINKLKDRCSELSHNINENNNNINKNMKTISDLYDKIKIMKIEKKKELDLLNGKLYDIYQLIEDTKIEYN